MSKSHPLQWRFGQSTVPRYGIAVLSVAIAIALAELLTVLLHTEPIASLMISAVMFAAWFGGFGPGLLAIALAVLAIHYYVAAPLNSFAVKSSLLSLGVAELPRLILFSIAAAFVNILSSTQRAAIQSIRRSRDELLAALEHQRQIEGALRQSEMYLAEAQQLSRTGSFSWDVSSGEILWSEESFRIFGHDQVPSVTVDMVLRRTHPEDRALVQSTIDRASREGKDFDYEYRLLTADGTVKYVHVVAHAVRDQANRLRFTGALTDVTATKQAEEELHKTRTELAHAARVSTLGELTASIAHETNQPLAAIINAAIACLRWLDRETPDLDEARRAVEWIIKEGNRAAEVIRRVRALASKASPEKAPLDINDVISEVIGMMQHELADHLVSTRMEFAPGLPVVLADRVELQQVIINLVMNGIEAMASITDRPRELVIGSRQDKAGQIVVTVEDCGVGIFPENAGRLFNDFFTTKSGGMGMGLRICRSIIEAHGGRLSAANNSGPGATFQFTQAFNEESTP
jgi:PAS domain S-box-containing protein